LLDSQLLVFDCPGQVAVGDFRLRPQVVDEGLLRVDLDCLREVGFGRGRVVHLQERKAPIREGHDVIRVALDGPSEVDDRLVELAQALQVHAAVVQAEWVLREQLDELVVGSHRLGPAACLDVDVGQRGPRAEVRRSQF
jgi:hypothetical protein